MRTFFAGIGVVGLCALCCLFPSLFIAATAGIVGIGLGFWKWGVLLISLSVVVFLFMKKNRTCNKDTGCNCSSGSCSHKK
ncbi:hypothetical protein [Peribacillus frigoritolerans]|uniref:hypothetical protein n=1 Tax=Peribacillus frigoritolerans TaxID=450367 RepID=UPI0007BF8C36|nr:hypothetical protein [Peribacillus frigoritolerans]USK67244.1 hypothetical protein LIT26_11890 [Peribacillus frigoritolerans]